MSPRALSSADLASYLAQAGVMAESAGEDPASLALPFFTRLAETPSQRSEWSTERICAQGEVVFEEGDPGDALYLILGGKLMVVADRFGKPRFLALRGPGEVIGEMALVENRPRMASVIALQDTRLLRFDRESFDALLHLSPEFGLEVMRILSGRLRVEARRSKEVPSAAAAALAEPEVGIQPHMDFEARLRELVERTGRAGEAMAPVSGDALDRLGARQLMILGLVSQGLTYKEIGGRLNLTERTIKYHMREIVSSLRVRNKAEAASLARRAGL